MKKIMQLVTVCLMVMGMFSSFITAFAAESSDSNRPESGNLTIYKYLYDGDAATEGNGSAGQTIPAGSEIIRGVSFSIYKVGALLKINDNDPTEEQKVKFAKISGGENVKYTYDNSSVTAHVTVNDITTRYTYSISFATQNGIPVNPPNRMTDDDGKIFLEGLDAAEYFVFESLSASTPEVKDSDDQWKSVTLTHGIDPFVVAVPMTVRTGDNEGTRWETDVYVHPKNRASNSLKTVDKEDGVTVGDSLEYYISSELADPDLFKSMTIWDQLDPGLTFEGSNIEMYKAKIETVDGKQVITTEGDALDTSLWTFSGPDADNKFTVEIDNDGLKALADLGIERIAIKVKAKINEDAKRVPLIDAVSGNIIENRATIELVHNDGTKVEDKTNEVKTRLGELEIIKTKKDDSPLVGAKFKISTSKANAEKGVFIKKEIGGKLYYPDPVTERYASDDAENNRIKALDDYEATSTLVQDPDSPQNEYAVAHFTGLKAANSENNFEIWVKETYAPKGYQLLGEAFNVRFKGESEEGIAGQAKASNYVWKDTVVNSNQFVLPKTGSLWVIILTMLGIVLIGLAILSNLNKKKEREA